VVRTLSQAGGLRGQFNKQCLQCLLAMLARGQWRPIKREVWPLRASATAPRRPGRQSHGPERNAWCSGRQQGRRAGRDRASREIVSGRTRTHARCVGSHRMPTVKPRDLVAHALFHALNRQDFERPRGAPRARCCAPQVKGPPTGSGGRTSECAARGPCAATLLGELGPRRQRRRGPGHQSASTWRT
jgi:hypothetical protein